MVKLIYTELNSVVQVNGFLTEPFEIKKGVKQGDALSCALFILAIDSLIRRIKNDIMIRELDMDTVPLKVVAYADDIAVITENSDREISRVFRNYEFFSQATGLFLNADKTEILSHMW